MADLVQIVLYKIHFLFILKKSRLKEQFKIWTIRNRTKINHLKYGHIRISDPIIFCPVFNSLHALTIQIPDQSSCRIPTVQFVESQSRSFLFFQIEAISGFPTQQLFHLLRYRFRLEIERKVSTFIFILSLSFNLSFCYFFLSPLCFSFILAFVGTFLFCPFFLSIFSLSFIFYLLLSFLSVFPFPFCFSFFYLLFLSTIVCQCPPFFLNFPFVFSEFYVQLTQIIPLQGNRVGRQHI